jgi:hypothetical protein
VINDQFQLVNDPLGETRLAIIAFRAKNPPVVRPYP